MALKFMTAKWTDVRHMHRNENIALDFRSKLVRFNSKHIKNGEVSDSGWHGRWMYITPTEIDVPMHFKGLSFNYLYAVKLLQDRRNPNKWIGQNYPVTMVVKGFVTETGEFIPSMPSYTHMPTL